MLPAARMSDMHRCPEAGPPVALGVGGRPHVGGPITGPCVSTMLFENQAAARLADYAGCDLAVDTIVEGAASVLLFSTVAATQGFSAHASVSMAKGAVEGLVLALGAELAPRIRVNAIAPSLTRTPLASPLTGNDSMAAAIAQMHALARLGEPEDMAPLAALLLSPSSGWITGQVIGVDGGRSTLRTKG